MFSGGVELSCKSFGFASSPGQWGMEEAKRWSVDVFLPRENCAVGHKELFLELGNAMYFMLLCLPV